VDPPAQRVKLTTLANSSSLAGQAERGETMMDYTERKELFERLIVANGTETQTRKAVEELTKLSLELQQSIANPRENDIEVLYQLANTSIMLDQLELIFEPYAPWMLSSLKDAKLRYLERHLEQEGA
jgi:carboxylesterase type B